MVWVIASLLGFVDCSLRASVNSVVLFSCYLIFICVRWIVLLLVGGLGVCWCLPWAVCSCVVSFGWFISLVLRLAFVVWYYGLRCAGCDC